MSNFQQQVSKKFYYLIATCYMTAGIVDVIVGSVWPVIATSLRVDISLIGVLVMLSYIGSIATSPNTYKIRKKIGTNYTMVLSMLCFVVSLTIYIFAKTIYSLAIGMFVNGIGYGLLEVNVSSYVLKAYGIREEAILFSLWSLGSVIGSAIMAISISYFPSYQSGFGVLIGALLINIALLIRTKAKWVVERQSLPKELLELHSVTEEEKKIVVKVNDIIKNKKEVFVLICFFLVQGVVITLNTISSTILVTKGGINDNTAVSLVIIYFAALFFGRIVFGKFAEKSSVMKVIKINTILVIMLFILLYLSPNNKFIIFSILILTGFTASPLLPLFNASIKELFDIKFLSALLGYGDVCGVIGIIIISGLSTLIMKMTSINYVLLSFVLFMLIVYVLLRKIEQIKK